jgi:hypothetical protein
MWNPAYDTIFCDSWSQELGIKFFFVDFLAQQFPDETNEVKYLALLSSHWENDKRARPAISAVPRKERDQLSWRFNALLELCVVLDEPYESEYIHSLMSLQKKPLGLRQNPPESLRVPRDIEVELRTHIMMQENTDCVVPTVRLVGSRERIVDGPNQSAVLRCYPCPDIFRLTRHAPFGGYNEFA